MSKAAISAGRGVLYIALAKAYFMVAGYAIYFALPRLLGSKEAWGNYLLVIGLVSIIDNVLVTATVQGVSRFTAQGDASADTVKRAALKVQLLLGGGVALLYFLMAPLIAHWERDAALGTLYRLSAGIVLCYSFYAVFVGSLNGQHQFGRQATLDAGFATIRAAAILGCAAAGLGAAGAIGGFVAAAALILVISAIWVGLPGQCSPFEMRRIWTFMAHLFVYTFALNLMMRADLFLIKRFAATLVSGSTTVKAAFASEAAGFYGTAQSLAFIPYQAILAVAFVIFPLISRATFEQDHEATRAYIRQTLRLSLVFVAGLAVVLVAKPESVINVPYPADYRVGGPALRVLALGMVCFSMFTIINTILNGAGRTRQTIVAALTTLGLVLAGNVILLNMARTREQILILPALATSGALAIGLLLSTVLLHRTLGAAFPARSVLRVAVAAGVTIAVGRIVPEVSKLVTLLECVLLLGVYGAALAAMGEFQREDVDKFARVFLRRRPR